MEVSKVAYHAFERYSVCVSFRDLKELNIPGLGEAARQLKDGVVKGKVWSSPVDIWYA